MLIPDPPLLAGLHALLRIHHVALTLLRGHEVHPLRVRHRASRGDRVGVARASHAPARSRDVHAFLLEVVSRDDVHEKVENVSLGNGGCDVVPLQCSPFVLLAVNPRPERQLKDKHLARLREQHGRFA